MMMHPMHAAVYRPMRASDYLFWNDPTINHRGGFQRRLALSEKGQISNFSGTRPGLLVLFQAFP
jgi:hypothetical protein